MKYERKVNLISGPRKKKIPNWNTRSGGGALFIRPKKQAQVIGSESLLHLDPCNRKPFQSSWARTPLSPPHSVIFDWMVGVGSLASALHLRLFLFPLGLVFTNLWLFFEALVQSLFLDIFGHVFLSRLNENHIFGFTIVWTIMAKQSAKEIEFR